MKGPRQRLQRGQAGELAAQHWFHRHNWVMVRTQPPVTILGMLTGPMIQMLSRYIPRLSYFGHMVIARMGKGGAPDFTGYMITPLTNIPVYRACEVKEAAGDSLRASVLDKSQREFMDKLPFNSARVGILWYTGEFEMFNYIPQGSYKRGQGMK